MLNGSNKWDWDKLTELRPDPGGDPASADWQIIKALENDQDGIAVANLNFVSSEEPLALAERPGEPFYSLTKENLFQRRYPLTRTVMAYINRAPGKPLDPKIEAFIRDTLIVQGQEAVAASGYTDLNPDIRAAQIAVLEKLSALNHE